MKSDLDFKKNSDDPRIDLMKAGTWVGYSRALAIRNQMDALLRHPKTHRMPGMALIGDTNNGKSMLLNNFRKRHNPPEDPNAEKTILPVLFIQTPPSPDEGRLYSAILERLSARGPTSERDDFKLSRIKTIFMHLETKMLMLDDFFNIGAGTPARRKRFLNALRNMTCELQIPIVVSGTPETLNVLSADPSLANRFKPAFLPRWKLDGEEDSLKEFSRFVLSMESKLLLKLPPNLFEDEEVLVSLLTLSEGLLGEVVDILHVLAESVIRSGSEKIDKTMVTRKNLQSLGWLMPSDRSRHRE